MTARDSLGVPPRERPSYFVWQEGEPLDVVWEFGVLTVKGGAGKKKETYRGMGVREYWLVDPVDGYHDPRLQGFQLLDGAYERLPWKEGSDGMVTVWSPLLQLKLRFANRQLRFWDRGQRSISSCRKTKPRRGCRGMRRRGGPPRRRRKMRNGILRQRSELGKR